MSPQQVHLLRKSFAELERHQQIAGLVFYRRLFEVAPELRPMFKDDIESQARKLTDMLGTLISLLDRGEALHSELRQMGARHSGYGVRSGHYDIVGGALLDMLAEVLGPRFTPEAREAWKALYVIITERMQAGAAEMEMEALPA